MADEGLGTALRRHVVLFHVTLDRLAADRARTVLATHGIAGNIGDRHLRSERSTLSFSSRTASGSSDTGGSMATMHSSCNRWFCTMSRSAPGLVVEARTAAHAHCFRTVILARS